MEITKPCPLCGASGEIRIGYPAVSALRLLDIIQHFHFVALAKHQDDLSHVSKKIGDLLERPVSARAVYTGWLRASRIYRRTGDYEDCLKTIGQFFRCNRVSAMAVLQIYMTEQTHQPEQTVVPVLVVTLVEILLSEFLRDLNMKRRNISYADAQVHISNLRSFDDRFADFARVTGTDLSKAMQNLCKPFWDQWIYVRRKRNYFVHGNPYAIGWETCERAYALAAQSIAIFARLNNDFVVKK